MSRRWFEQAMERMRGTDVRVRDDAFDFLREHADTCADELIAEFAADRDDHGLRCRLLELIAEARSPKALDVFRDQLDGTDESLRFWAVRGLEMLDTREAERVLDEARADGWVT
ncbi:HEAT repeat domain-containing protein [Actinomadura darangshiensis]|uniref:HEAT repeat domain-containing protein n=1 Tax=Actinomadura darangshiensis TaxID=705336 RepID=A0A4R5AKT7_9ACTN|nr:HEAT repeat domain-containing protein [Actinomadura darangshiensis]TDD73283.1 HEAT repeat domain-containing protein [Actinomadura darangshiensis]